MQEFTFSEYAHSQDPAIPVISGLEELRGHMELKGDRVASLGVRLELQALKSFLTTLKGDMDSGIKRIEAVLGSLEFCGLNMGSGD